VSGLGSVGKFAGKLGLAFLLASASVVAVAKGPSSVDTVQAVALSALPQEAQSTHRLILEGGPFPYPKDGSVFGNRERLLPVHPKGFYREYTVRTPGSRDRGARRMVCGGQEPAKPEACYYTADHYATFQRVVQ
jgi:ribonuclease T1